MGGWGRGRGEGEKRGPAGRPCLATPNFGSKPGQAGSSWEQKVASPECIHIKARGCGARCGGRPADFEPRGPERVKGRCGGYTRCRCRRLGRGRCWAPQPQKAKAKAICAGRVFIFSILVCLFPSLSLLFREIHNAQYIIHSRSLVVARAWRMAAAAGAGRRLRRAKNHRYRRPPARNGGRSPRAEGDPRPVGSRSRREP
jgi:hypothetical protein